MESIPCNGLNFFYVLLHHSDEPLLPARSRIRRAGRVIKGGAGHPVFPARHRCPGLGLLENLQDLMLAEPRFLHADFLVTYFEKIHFSAPPFSHGLPSSCGMASSSGNSCPATAYDMHAPAIRWSAMVRFCCCPRHHGSSAVPTSSAACCGVLDLFRRPLNDNDRNKRPRPRTARETEPPSRHQRTVRGPRGIACAHPSMIEKGKFRHSAR